MRDEPLHLTSWNIRGLHTGSLHDRESRTMAISACQVCMNRYVSIRQHVLWRFTEKIEIIGKLFRSFYRGCDGRTKVFERNNCQIEKDERTCFTACVGDLCNHGNGLVDHIVHSGSILTGSKADGWVFTVTTAVLLVFSAILLSGNA